MNDASSGRPSADLAALERLRDIAWRSFDEARDELDACLLAARTGFESTDPGVNAADLVIRLDAARATAVAAQATVDAAYDERARTLAPLRPALHDADAADDAWIDVLAGERDAALRRIAEARRELDAMLPALVGRSDSDLLSEQEWTDLSRRVDLFADLQQAQKDLDAATAALGRGRPSNGPTEG